MSDSDSSRTVDSHELREILGKPLSQGCRASRSTKLYEISDDSDDNETKPLKQDVSRSVEVDISDDSDTNDNETKTTKEDISKKLGMKKEAAQTPDDNRPLCKYGSDCYRKNPEHHRQFQHPKDDDNSILKKKRMKLDHGMTKKAETLQQMSHFNFFFTTVSGIDPKYNQILAQNIRDLLKPSEGKLKASVQFNYMVDVPWLMRQYPPEFRNCPLLIVHGEQRGSKRKLEESAKSFPNVTFCQAKLEIMYGTHHTKMMLLLYEDGLRVVIHTSNLIDGDWDQKTQGMWVSPKFPPLPAASLMDGESCTRFRADLVEYLTAYKSSVLESWCETIKKHDMSSARVFLIGSIPGRHIGSQKTAFGHLKLRKTLTAHAISVTPDWPVIGQFSSIGSLGSNHKQWLCGEWLTSLATVKGLSMTQNVPLKLIFPSVDDVRMSLEGYPAGASLPYGKSTASKQPYLTSFLHHWKSSQFGRSHASPHIKSYCRIDPEMTKIAWILVTSANLSKAAWGALEKNGTQLMIRSYELGVLFIPRLLCGDDCFFVSGDNYKNNMNRFPLPFDVPLTPYKPSDEPWIWDIPHTKAPDRNGNMWCPPS